MKTYLIPLAIAAAIAVPGFAHADTVTVTADANCDTFTIHVEGLRDGERLMVEQGSMPPYGFVMGSGVYWQFQVTADGTADAVLRATTDPWFTADVVVIRGLSIVPLFHQMVDCSGTAPEVDPTGVVIPEVVDVVAVPVPDPLPTVVEAPVVDYEIWADVALAPPW